MASLPKTPPEDAAPAAPEPATAESAAPETPEAPAPFAAEYLDEIPRTYHFPGAPQTAEKGDVCRIPYDPGDGRWKPTRKAVTRLADNDPEQFPITAARQAAAAAEKEGEQR